MSRRVSPGCVSSRCASSRCVSSGRVSVWGGLSLSLLTLGSCLLPDVGIDPALDREVGAAQGGSAGSGANGGSAAAGNGGSATAAAGSAGSSSVGGSEGTPPVVVPPQAGSAGMVAGGNAGNAGNAGTGSMPPNAGGTGGAGGADVGLVPDAAESCPETTDREEACFAYCQLYTDVCQGFSLGGLTPYDYENTLDCVSFCTDPANGWGVGTIASGNTILCRCAHAFLARTVGENPHCFHSARVPTAMCL